MKSITIRFDEGGVIFRLGDEEYFLDRADLEVLQDREKSAGAMRAVSASRFRDFDEPRFVARYDYLARFGYSEEELLRLLGVGDRALFHEWLNANEAKRQGARQAPEYATATRWCEREFAHPRRGSDN